MVNLPESSVDVFWFQNIILTIALFEIGFIFSVSRHNNPLKWEKKIVKTAIHMLCEINHIKNNEIKKEIK